MVFQIEIGLFIQKNCDFDMKQLFFCVRLKKLIYMNQNGFKKSILFVFITLQNVNFYYLFRKEL